MSILDYSSGTGVYPNPPHENPSERHDCLECGYDYFENHSTAKDIDIFCSYECEDEYEENHSRCCGVRFGHNLESRICPKCGEHD